MFVYIYFWVDLLPSKTSHPNPSLPCCLEYSKPTKDMYISFSDLN